MRVALALSRLLQMRQTCLSAYEGPAHIDAEHQVEALHWGRFGRRQADCARVVDQDVDSTERFDRFLGGGCYLLFIANVAGDRKGLPTCGLYFFSGAMNSPRQFGIRFDGFGCDRNVGAVGGSALDDCQPDAARTAGYENGLAGKVHFFDHRIICVQRNNAIVLPVSVCETFASQTCVVRPWCAALASARNVPSIAVPRKFAFNSIVVKLDAPSGRWAIVA